ncbi:Uncharacterised protein [[Actinobacillus] rossii]|uniref:Uncharacterized protein n=1 Tax=[Actinobacillus] rossii TaxID=123820 RepID=A0A380TNK8_9PAST|nr:Uncharacterised protein [[Actinobacillus] rossii]
MFKHVLILTQQIIVFLLANLLFVGIFSVNIFISFTALIFSMVFARKTSQYSTMSLRDTWRNSRLLVTMII